MRGLPCVNPRALIGVGDWLQFPLPPNPSEPDWFSRRIVATSPRGQRSYFQLPGYRPVLQAERALCLAGGEGRAY